MGVRRNGFRVQASKLVPFAVKKYICAARCASSCQDNVRRVFAKRAQSDFFSFLRGPLLNSAVLYTRLFG